MDKMNLLLDLALDLSKTLGAEDRLHRLLNSIRDTLGADAASLILRGDGELSVQASHGLNAKGKVLKWKRKEQPRLEEILKAEGPVVFPESCDLKDPFDGFLAEAPEALHSVHSCMGIPLKVEDELLGCITADSLELGVFDEFGEEFLTLLGALASAALKSALEREQLENEALRKAEWARSLQREKEVDSNWLSPVMLAFEKELHLVANSPFPLLLLGETGVGKEVAARLAHKVSPRAERPFVVINCAAIAKNLVESELFGHEKGAFTGAEKERAGKFEIAHGGTLFLDEIGELPLEIQAKLLRTLQEGEVQRVGSEKVLKVDVRIFAATNRNLAEEVGEGRFRADLFHRIATFPLVIPPLRNRHEDIPALVDCFLRELEEPLHLENISIDPKALEWLIQGEWLGNVRELKNVIMAATLRAKHRSLQEQCVVKLADFEGMFEEENKASLKLVAPFLNEKMKGEGSLKEKVEAFKTQLIEEAVKKSKGNLSEAAKSLGVDRSNLYNQCKKRGLLEKRI